MRRILITGSRGWVDVDTIRIALAQEAWVSNGDAVVVHGTAHGADQLASRQATLMGLAVEEHPADWSGPCDSKCPPGHRGDYCPRAGHRRNQKMVDLGADVLLAFILDQSRGASDCAKRAEAAGIPVRYFRHVTGRSPKGQQQ